jgi:alpha-D-xyloside xylohydrolase
MVRYHLTGSTETIFKEPTMKFTDGYWEMRPGMIPHYAAQVHEVVAETDALTVYAPVGRLQERGHTVNQPLLTVRYSSPMENVIRVQVVHHKGVTAQPPSFEIHEESARQVSISVTDHFALLQSGDLSVRVQKGNDWLVEFVGGERVLTSSGWRALGFVDTPSGRFIHEQLSLGIGECVYGLGERFTAFAKNGQVVDMWNQDGGTSSEQAYKNIPFYLTNRGYGVFVNQPE